MKKILLVLAAALIFVGCKKDEPIVTFTDGIVGKWVATEAFDPIDNVYQSIKGTSADGFFIEFNKDAIYTAKLATLFTGKYTIKNSVITCAMAAPAKPFFVDFMRIDANNAIMDIRYDGEFDLMRYKFVKQAIAPMPK